jgi:ABC-type branched-subunit amino acid transport system substrate-binding protein
LLGRKIIGQGFDPGRMVFFLLAGDADRALRAVHELAFNKSNGRLMPGHIAQEHKQQADQKAKEYTVMDECAYHVSSLLFVVQSRFRRDLGQI